MLRVVICITAFVWFIRAPARAQTPAEIAGTCNTLAALTEDASRRKEVNNVLLYINTADAIRSTAGPETCNVDYFTKVRSANEPLVGSNTLLISLSAVRPIKGWRHREVDDLFKLIESENPSQVIALQRLQLQRLPAFAELPTLSDWQSRLKSYDALLRSSQVNRDPAIRR